jgi:hypothetical protein
MARTVTAWERFKERLYPYVILIAVIVAVDALVINIYFYRRDHWNGWELAYLCIVAFLLIMTCWCFIKTFFTDPGVPPLFWVHRFY